MTAGSCSVAISRRRPPQWAHANTSMPNARCIRAAQLQARGLAAFIAELARHGYDQSGIEFFSAPGSLEIPLMAKKLAKTGKYAAVCASGFVVDGGIYRHEFVAQAVLQGIVQTSLETEVPILSAVLTPHQFHDHADHHEFFRSHMVTKGKELAGACLSIIENLAAVA